MTHRGLALLSILFWLSSAFAGDRRMVGEPAIRSTGEHVAAVARTASPPEYLPGQHRQVPDRRAPAGALPLLVSSADVRSAPARPRLATFHGRGARIPIADARTFPYDANAPPAGSR